MSNAEIADVLSQMATLYEIAGGERFRVRRAGVYCSLPVDGQEMVSFFKVKERRTDKCVCSQ